MQLHEVRIRATGAGLGLLMNSDALVDPLNPLTRQLAEVTGKRKKTQSDHEKMAELEWFGRMNADAEGRPVVTGDQFQKAVVMAARKERKGKDVESGLWVFNDAPIEHDGPQDLSSLWKDPGYRLRKSVRVGQARVMRTRPLFRNWSAVFDVRFDPEILDLDAVIRFAEVAGYRIGIGDWRPKYGRFEAEVLP